MINECKKIFTSFSHAMRFRNAACTHWERNSTNKTKIHSPRRVTCALRKQNQSQREHNKKKNKKNIQQHRMNWTEYSICSAIINDYKSDCICTQSSEEICFTKSTKRRSMPLIKDTTSRGQHSKLTKGIVDCILFSFKLKIGQYQKPRMFNAEGS